MTWKATSRGREEANIVRNQELEYIEVWKPWEYEDKICLQCDLVYTYQCFEM